MANSALSGSRIYQLAISHQRCRAQALIEDRELDENTYANPRIGQPCGESPSPPANQCDSGGRDLMPNMRTAETPAFCRYGEAIEWQLLLEWGSIARAKALGD